MCEKAYNFLLLKRRNKCVKMETTVTAHSFFFYFTHYFYFFRACVLSRSSYFVNKMNYLILCFFSLFSFSFRLWNEFPFCGENNSIHTHNSQKLQQNSVENCIHSLFPKNFNLWSFSLRLT